MLIAFTCAKEDVYISRGIHLNADSNFSFVLPHSHGKQQAKKVWLSIVINATALYCLIEHDHLCGVLYFLT